jgi:hypothetical protein
MISSPKPNYPKISDFLGESLCVQMSETEFFCGATARPGATAIQAEITSDAGLTASARHVAAAALVAAGALAARISGSNRDAHFVNTIPRTR